MSNFVFAINADEVPPGRAVMVQIGEKFYAVCNDGINFHATDECCPHEEGHLGRGEVHDGCLVCPVHHWAWNLKTGLADPEKPYIRLKMYPCQVRDGKVYVDTSSPIRPGHSERNEESPDQQSF